MTSANEGSELGFLDLSTVGRHWQALRDFYQLRLIPLETPNPKDYGLTARKIDESQPAGHRGWIAAFTHLQSGLEHIDALQYLLQARATSRAPWTLLRSVFEAGFWSTRLLEPEDGPTRRLRGLRLEVAGARQRTAFYDEFFRFRPEVRNRLTIEHADHDRTFRAEATAMGVSWDRVKQPVSLLEELKKLTVVRNMENDIRAATVATWRSLSGMQHGYAYATMLNSDMHGEGDEIVGGRRATITIKDEAFAASASAATHLLLAGMQVYERRSVRP